MGNNICIYSGKSFDESTREHILQASFGARWDCKTLICQEMQERFAGVIDNAVADGIFQLRSLFGTKSGRGKVPLPIKDVPTASGMKYDLQPGMQPTFAKASYKIEAKPDGTLGVHFIMSHEKQLPELVARFKRENPNLKFDDTKLGKGAPSQSYLDEPLKLQLVFGGNDFFRGILKSAFNLLGVNHPDIALDSGFDPLKRLIVDGTGNIDDFVRWIPSSEILPIEHIGSIDHTLAVWSQNRTVFGLLEMFGDVPFLLKLGEGITSDNFFYGYVVNPLRDTSPAENRAPKIDINQIPAFSESPAKPNPAIWKVFETRVTRIVQKLHGTGIEARIKQIVDEVLLPHDGELITEEMIDDLMNRMREFIEHLVMPDNTKPE